MIESVSDAIQLLVLAVCFAFAVVRALRERNSMWVTTACFFACMFLGNAYWLGFQLVFGDTPHYSYIADLGWISGYMFLLMLVADNDKRREVSAPTPIAWLPVVICIACCAYYIAVSGSPLLNVVENGLMAAIGYFAVRGIVAESANKSGGSHLAANKAFHIAVLAFVVIEQALWLSSCFLEPGLAESVAPYIVIGYILTLSYAVILACAWRSADA